MTAGRTSSLAAERPQRSGESQLPPIGKSRPAKWATKSRRIIGWIGLRELDKQAQILKLQKPIMGEDAAITLSIKLVVSKQAPRHRTCATNLTMSPVFLEITVTAGNIFHMQSTHYNYVWCHRTVRGDVANSV